MQVKNETPPNYSEIIAALPAVKEDTNAIFCYGNTIHNPRGRELTPDLIHHEKVHMRQQALYTSPDIWWRKYLSCPAFRLSQEMEAYGEQYLFAKRLGARGKLLEWVLEDVSRAVSSPTYGSLISWNEAKSKIRNYTPPNANKAS